ncbi:MAG: hypothetical protein RIC55_29730 [Pirellulaceae bacterium]
MSRSYRIRVRDSLRRILRAKDHVGTQLELLPILPPEAMAELLAEQLLARGFEQDGDVLRREQNGVVVRVDLADGTVTISLEEDEHLTLERARDGQVFGESRGEADAATDKIRKDLARELSKEAQEHQAQLQQRVTERLEGELADLQRELDQTANRVTAEALKRKAAQLGNIKQVTDDAETGELTIVVEL